MDSSPTLSIASHADMFQLCIKSQSAHLTNTLQGMLQDFEELKGKVYTWDQERIWQHFRSNQAIFVKSYDEVNRLSSLWLAS